MVLLGPVDMEEVFRRLKPVFVKTDRGILKATDTYLDTNDNANIYSDFHSDHNPY